MQITEIEKKEANRLSLYLSSLFARKQKYFYMDMNNPSVIITTNRHYLDILAYKPVFDETISRIEIKDPEVVELFKKVLGSVEVSTIMINAVHLSSALKNNMYDSLIYDYPEFNCCYRRLKPGKREDETDAYKYFDVVTFIDMGEFVSLVNIFDSYNFPESKRWLSESIDGIRFGKDVLYTQVENDKAWFKFPSAGGFNSVSSNEYVKKSKLEGTYTIHCMFDIDSIRYVIEFNNSELNVVTTYPYGLIFPKHK